jgi:hypothetical protein
MVCKPSVIPPAACVLDRVRLPVGQQQQHAPRDCWTVTAHANAASPISATIVPIEAQGCAWSIAVGRQVDSRSRRQGFVSLNAG